MHRRDSNATNADWGTAINDDSIVGPRRTRRTISIGSSNFPIIIVAPSQGTISCTSPDICRSFFSLCIRNNAVYIRLPSYKLILCRIGCYYNRRTIETLNLECKILPCRHIEIYRNILPAIHGKVIVQWREIIITDMINCILSRCVVMSDPIRVNNSRLVLYDTAFTYVISLRYCRTVVKQGDVGKICVSSDSNCGRDRGIIYTIILRRGNIHTIRPVAKIKLLRHTSCSYGRDSDCTAICGKYLVSDSRNRRKSYSRNRRRLGVGDINGRFHSRSKRKCFCNSSRLLELDCSAVHGKRTKVIGDALRTSQNQLGRTAYSDILGGIRPNAFYLEHSIA